MQNEYKFENIEINIELDSGVVFEEKSPFDSTLAYLYAQELKSKGEYEKYEYKHLELPFIKKTKSVYHTSYPITDKDGVFIENNTITKSFDKKLYKKIGEEKKRNIDIQRGAFKSDLVNFERKYIKNIKFYICGDIDKIEKLLQNLTHFGKKSSLNFGKVKSIRLKTINKDLSLLNEDNKPNRILPVDDFPSVNSKNIAMHRPVYPYYIRNDMVQCYI